jgi:hypothetical protein
MSSSDVLLLFLTSLIVIFRVRRLVCRLWNYPLAHGAGFFLGVAVAPGFYAGPGTQWLRRYRTAVLTEHAFEALVLLVILVSGHWDRLPLLALCVVPSMATMFGFTAWTRKRHGAAAPVPSRVAIALESRRLGDYISWPTEALIGAIIAFSWVLLLTHGDAQVRWQAPVVMTYTILWLLPAKIGIVRYGFPLPAERTEEHNRWVNAERRYRLRLMDGFCWFVLVILAGYALLHGWPAAKAVAGFRWLLIGLALGVWLLQVRFQIRGESHLTAMGRGLRPAFGRPGLFRGGTLMTPRGWSWSAAYLTGLILLLVFFRR